MISLFNISIVNFKTFYNISIVLSYSESYIIQFAYDDETNMYKEIYY